MGAVSSIVSIVGLAVSGAGTLQQMKAQKDQAKASEKAEKAREKQADLEASRQRRKIARDSQRRRAEVLASGTNQGAQQSSGVIGGIQQTTAEASMATRDVNEAQEYGGQVFAANRQYASAGGKAAFGQGLQSLGQGLVKSAQTFQRLGTYGMGG